jgi:hypothetical protein
MLHGHDGAPVKAHADRLRHVHVLRNSTLIDGQMNDAETLETGFSSLLCVFRLDEVSQDRRRCCAILIGQFRLGTGTSRSSEHERAQKSSEKAMNRMFRISFHADPSKFSTADLTPGPMGGFGSNTMKLPRNGVMGNFFRVGTFRIGSIQASPLAQLEAVAYHMRDTERYSVAGHQPSENSGAIGRSLPKELPTRDARQGIPLQARISTASNLQVSTPVQKNASRLTGKTGRLHLLQQTISSGRSFSPAAP